ncbi:MAG: family NAD(P)-dependent oxidoreductase [Cytophagaceae bacterium]|jgi:short-subunit dehydrogenase|nr:family NAD(P)-dependent oxidoreductase [Cytophagaceae bacterium]
MTTTNQYAIVTGASRGLGKEYVSELARRGINIILVSLPGEELDVFSLEISLRYSVKTHYYETDLSVNKNVLDLADWVNQHFEVFLLINNAGTGGSRAFLQASAQYITTIIQLNIMATSVLTRQLLPNLIRQPQAYILNVSSMAAFFPIGFKTVYPASKSFVYSFSRGLNEELSGTNVFVSVVNPGPLKTSLEIAARIDKQGLFAKLGLIEPHTFAQKSMDKLFQKYAVIVLNPFSLLFLRLIPSRVRVPLMTNVIKRELYV